jgi:hypothetical protein
MGSITSFGEQDVLKCETDDPLSTGFGAYISTWPVAASRPPLRMALLATTAAPVASADCPFILRGRGTLRVGHGGPRRRRPAVVLEVQHVGVVPAAQELAVRLVDEGEEAEAVTDLVEDDGDEVDLAAARVAVEAVVPGIRERAGRPDRAVERRADVGVRRRVVRPAELVRERLRIPGLGDRRAAEVGVHGRRPGLPEDRARPAARERIHVGGHRDRDGARELRAPDVRRELERGEALRAERRRAVAADRRDDGRVVEALARPVAVDDGDGRGAPGAEADQQRERDPCEPDADHSVGCPWSMWSVPSGPTVATSGLRKRPWRSIVTPPSGARVSTSPAPERLNAAGAGMAVPGGGVLRNVPVRGSAYARIPLCALASVGSPAAGAPASSTAPTTIHTPIPFDVTTRASPFERRFRGRRRVSNRSRWHMCHARSRVDRVRDRRLRRPSSRRRHRAPSRRR